MHSICNDSADWKNEIIHEERIPSNFSCVREGPAVDIMGYINIPPVNGSLTDLVYIR